MTKCFVWFCSNFFFFLMFLFVCQNKEWQWGVSGCVQALAGVFANTDWVCATWGWRWWRGRWRRHCWQFRNVSWRGGRLHCNKVQFLNNLKAHFNYLLWIFCNLPLKHFFLSFLFFIFLDLNQQLKRGVGATLGGCGVTHWYLRTSSQWTVPEIAFQSGRTLSCVWSCAPENVGSYWNLQSCLLCNPQHYPDYYAIIKEPIDLRTIAQRIQVCPFCCVCSLCLFTSS